MTTEQKTKKIDTLKEEILRINKKLGALLVQKGRLQDRLEELEKLEPKDPQVPTQAEKEEQSRKDKEKYQNELLEALEDTDLPEDEISAVRSRVKELKL